ncbi:MAG: DUF1800 domain-containing protein [Chloroflexi bacterium]|nr:DUF1800 domain-containing protein [Chloroflexota bacterium]
MMTDLAPPEAAPSASTGPAREAASGPLPASRAPRLVSRAGLLAGGLAALRATIAGAAASRSGQHAPLLTERDKVAHLLRRAGFGYSHDELDYYAGIGLRGAVDRLLNYDAVPDDVDERLSRLELHLANASDLQRWWLLRMIYTQRPLQEKLAYFWHGLLVSGYGKVGLPQPRPENPNPRHLMLNQIQFFREHALDEHASIIQGISRDPAMIVYLDSQTNRKGKPNENYARELMELFALGIAGPDGQPNYTEQEIREIARAFTGWRLNAQREFAYRPAQHDDGKKTIFGVTGNFNGDDVADLIMAHPSAPYYIAKRLFEFFAYDNPESGVLAPIADAYRASGGRIRAVVEAILTSPAFYSERAYRAKVKSPVEYLAGIARALKLETNARGLDASARRMGQTLFNPPNVAGWPGGDRWINTTSWLERVNQANRILTIRRDQNTQPVNLLQIVQQRSLTTPEQAVDYFLQLLLDGQVLPEQRQTLIDYVSDGNLWPKSGLPVKDTDPAVDRKIRGLIYLIMSMPEYQLA